MEGEDIAIYYYYAYLKVNKGVTYREFLEEDIDVVQLILSMKSWEIEKQESEIKKNKFKK